MSGIAGIYNLDGQPADRELLGRMTAAIAHRGPDGAGQWVDGAVGFGHQMLCTTPESLRERQPLRDHDWQLCLVMDGRVDNRAELRAALLARGARPRDDTDAELVLCAYDVWGEQCPREIIGDFAFAIWDARRQQLFCARDLIGVKPFYYHFDGRTFRFGSELHQILQDEAISRAPNEGMIGEFLSEIVSTEETIYKDIMRLPPAHMMVIQRERVRKASYWNISLNGAIRYRDDAEYAEHFLALFKDILTAHLRSQTDVGVALSGGLDSSSIACVAQSLIHGGLSPARNVIAFSGVYPGLHCDESNYIQDVIEKAGLQSSIVQYSPADLSIFAQQVPRYRDLPDYPNGGFSNPIARSAHAQGIRVVLDGIGGDEWLTGSDRSYADMLRGGHVAELYQAFKRDVQLGGLASASVVILANGVKPLLPSRIQRTISRVYRRARRAPEWIDARFARRISLSERILVDHKRHPGLSFAQSDIYDTSTSGYSTYAFELENRASASLSVEQRHPFHDRRMIEFALALPEDQRCRHGQIKYILRQAMLGYLPESVRCRDTKAEFSPLFEAVLDQCEVEQLFSAPLIAETGWINSQIASKLYDQARDPNLRRNNEHLQLISPLWNIINLELWYTLSIANRHLAV